MPPNTAPKRSWLNQLPIILALLIIGGLLIAWKPWEAGANASDRTITVTGEAEITAEPDEYAFNPQYQFKDADKQAALKAATAHSKQVVAKLKELGVKDSKIKTDTSGGYNWYYNDEQDTYYASVSVKVEDKAKAQKVQDYLLSTAPTGSVTPQATFSKEKKQELTSDGRDHASKDARSKAEQSAANLGFKIGKVKTVKDQPDTGYFEAYGRTLELGVADAVTSGNSAPIQQGEDNLTYRVTVTYYVR